MAPHWGHELESHFLVKPYRVRVCVFCGFLQTNVATAVCVVSLSVSSRTFTSVYRVAVHVGLSFCYRLRQNSIKMLFSGCANFTMQRTVAKEASREKNIFFVFN